MKNSEKSFREQKKALKVNTILKFVLGNDINIILVCIYISLENVTHFHHPHFNLADILQWLHNKTTIQTFTTITFHYI